MNPNIQDKTLLYTYTYKPTSMNDWHSCLEHYILRYSINCWNNVLNINLNNLWLEIYIYSYKNVYRLSIKKMYEWPSFEN